MRQDVFEMALHIRRVEHFIVVQVFLKPECVQVRRAKRDDREQDKQVEKMFHGSAFLSENIGHEHPQRL